MGVCACECVSFHGKTSLLSSFIVLGVVGDTWNLMRDYSSFVGVSNSRIGLGDTVSDV